MLIEDESQNTNASEHAIFEDGNGNIVLQERENGKISMFGGRIKIGENPVDALKRELLEETEIDVTNLNKKWIGEYEKTIEFEGVYQKVNVWQVWTLDPKDIIVHEGKGIYLTKPENILTHPLATRITKLAIEDYLKNKNGHN